MRVNEDWYEVVATVFNDKGIAHRGYHSNFTMSPCDVLAALPARSALGQIIEVYCPSTERYACMPVFDLGPWFISDPYWLSVDGIPLVVREPSTPTYSTGEPATSKAALDLSPAAWVLLGVDKDEAYSLKVKRTVLWRFI